jgi:hypothetical protein
MEAAVRDFTRRRFGRITPASLRTVAFALVDAPYGASRRYLLAGKPHRRPLTSSSSGRADACCRSGRAEQPEQRR